MLVVAYRHRGEYRDYGRDIENMGYLALVERRDSEDGYMAFVEWRGSEDIG